MKIGVLGPADPFRGGIAQFLHTMTEYLSSENEVYVFSFMQQYPPLIFPGKSQIENTNRQYNFPIFRTLTPYNPATWKKTSVQIKMLDLDHLIIKFWIPFFCPAYTFIINYLKKKSNTKIHILCHNLDFHEKWYFAKFLTKKMVLNADSLIVLSENVRMCAEKLLNSIHPSMKKSKRQKPISVINLFHPLYDVSPEAYNKKSSFEVLNLPEKQTVLFFGFIKHYKGLDVLLRAIPLVDAILPNIQYVIAGEFYTNTKKYYSIMKNTSYEKVKSDIIIHDKYIYLEQIPHYFTVSDIVVVPYRSATQSGIVQMAYSYQRPVIVSNINGLKEMVKANKTGLLFENENHTDLAMQIVDYFQMQKHKDFQNEIQKNNKQFTWKSFIEKLLSEI